MYTIYEYLHISQINDEYLQALSYTENIQITTYLLSK